MTQNEKVVAYMQEHGSITTKQAFRDLGVSRLSARIKDLMYKGVSIRKESKVVTNRDGKKTRVTAYSLNE